MAPWCGGLCPLFVSYFDVLVPRRKIRCLAFVSSNFENLPNVTFLKPKTAENRN
jgi:hypothetical protein